MIYPNLRKKDDAYLLRRINTIPIAAFHPDISFWWRNLFTIGCGLVCEDIIKVSGELKIGYEIVISG